MRCTQSVKEPVGRVATVSDACLVFAGIKNRSTGQNNAVDGAEDHEGPICAMPQTGKDHGYKKISGGFPLTVTAAT